MAAPSPGGSGEAAWSAQVLVAHGIRALREAQSVITELTGDIEPTTTDHVHILLTAALEHARGAYQALNSVAGE